MQTILLIEDSQNIRENTAEILELGGYRVVTAENGKAGLASAFSELPDLVLCDIQMPLLNGYKVLLTLQRIEATRHIPFVFLTCSSEKKDLEAGLAMGASGYIIKPFEGNELLSSIATILNDTTQNTLKPASKRRSLQ